MKLAEVSQEIDRMNSIQELTKKRFACASCGTTWLEPVGLVIGKQMGSEDICLRIGMESEACQVCRMKPRTCHKCGSKDTYEIRFNREISEAPLNYNSIKKVRNNR